MRDWDKEEKENDRGCTELTKALAESNLKEYKKRFDLIPLKLTAKECEILKDYLIINRLDCVEMWKDGFYDKNETENTPENHDRCITKIVETMCTGITPMFSVYEMALLDHIAYWCYDDSYDYEDMNDLVKNVLGTTEISLSKKQKITREKQVEIMSNLEEKIWALKHLWAGGYMK